VYNQVLRYLRRVEKKKKKKRKRKKEKKKLNMLPKGGPYIILISLQYTDPYLMHERKRPK
jgi:hypothetical protein